MNVPAYLTALQGNFLSGHIDWVKFYSPSRVGWSRQPTAPVFSGGGLHCLCDNSWQRSGMHPAASWQCLCKAEVRAWTPWIQYVGSTGCFWWASFSQGNLFWTISFSPGITAARANFPNRQAEETAAPKQDAEHKICIFKTKSVPAGGEGPL